MSSLLSFDHYPPSIVKKTYYHYPVNCVKLPTNDNVAIYHIKIPIERALLLRCLANELR